MNETDGLLADAQIESDDNQQQAEETTISHIKPDNETIASEHLNGAKLNVLSTADDALIIPGDDFGFNESLDFFESGANFSPTRKVDI